MQELSWSCSRHARRPSRSRAQWHTHTTCRICTDNASGATAAFTLHRQATAGHYSAHKPLQADGGLTAYHSHQASASLHLGQGHADDDARRKGGGGHGEHARGRHHGRRLGAGGVARAPGCSKAGTSATFGLALERRHCSLRYPSSGALLSGPEAAPSKRVGGSVSEWAAVRGN